MKIDTTKLTIAEARRALKHGEFSAVELTQACLDVIKEKDGDIHAFLQVFDGALNEAREADKQIKAGVNLPLLGIPIALKDNMMIEGNLITAGSKILEGFRAPYSATVINKLREAGAVFIGRTNMDEFAMGSSTENSAFGATKNPYELDHVAGGSSGGSAAAVASGMALGAYGSDTGGSIREPASWCGVVGMKPTYGKVSRYGLIAMASSFDQIGPFGKTVEDTEILYKAVAGPDCMDSTSLPENIYSMDDKFKKVIGVPREFVNMEGVDPEVKKNFEKSLEKLKNLGYEIRDVSLPHLSYSLAVYYIIMPAEVSSNLARFDGVKYGLHVSGENGIDDYLKTRGAGFGEEARRRIILGTYVLSSGYYDAYYGRAVQAKSLIKQELQEAFKDIDFLLTPTAPTPAFKLGEKTADPLSMYLADLFTVPANIAGLPSISVPSGFTAGNLPLGVLLTGNLGREDKIFMGAKDFEV